MGQVDEFLRRWLAAEVVDQATAERIRVFEAAREAERERDEDDRPGVIEVLLYLGVAVLAVGVFALMAQNWPELQSEARVAALAVPALLCLGGGALMRVSPEAGIKRAGQIAWLASLGLVAGTMAVYFNEFEPGGLEFEDDRASLLILACTMVALALTLWAFSPSHAQVLGMAGATAFFAQALGNWPDQFSEGLAGATMFAAGAAAIAMIEFGHLKPKESSRLLFGAMAIAGPYQAGFIDNGMPYELLTFGVAGALVALGIARWSFTYVLVGVAGLFVALVTFIFEHFEDDIGAPLALILSGAVLIGAVLLLARFRPALRKGRVAA